MIDSGAEVAKTTNPIEVVIVASAPEIGRTFYKEYTPGDVTPPLCWSKDGKSPDQRSPERQSAFCADCPRAQKQASGKGAECRFSHNLAVVMHGDASNKVLRLSVPAMSLFGDGDPAAGKYSYLGFRKRVAAAQVAQSGIVTRLSFDDAESTPKLHFAMAGYVDEARFNQLGSLDPDVLRAYIAYGPDGMSGVLPASGVDSAAKASHTETPSAGADEAYFSVGAAGEAPPSPAAPPPSTEPRAENFGFGQAPAQSDFGVQQNAATPPAAGGNPFAVQGETRPTMGRVDDILDRLG
jgi:hypothetical protein